MLPEIILEDQTRFMKGQNICHTIRKTIDIIDYTSKHHVQGFLLNLDFEKCFDKIEYQAIRGALKIFSDKSKICGPRGSVVE